jgi:hypothetical protein
MQQIPGLALHNQLLMFDKALQMPVAGMFCTRSCSETVGRMDAADEPTGTYLRRVSEQDRVQNMSA